MFKSLVCLIAALAVFSVPALADDKGQKTYDLLFKNGTLNEISKDQMLVYDRTVTNSLKPETGERDTGTIELEFDGGDPLRARLKFIQNDKYRNLGAFPASVGNPIIMYFVETVVRDMAETAGGSPFYIRNRVKESLVQPAEINAQEATFQGQLVPATAVTLHPFRDDPNKEQMKGFGDLELVVVMSDEVPGWYQSLTARVPAPSGESAVYSSTLKFDRVGTPK